MINWLAMNTTNQANKKQRGFSFVTNKWKQMIVGICCDSKDQLGGCIGKYCRISLRCIDVLIKIKSSNNKLEIVAELKVS